MTTAQRTITALLVGKQDGCLPRLEQCLKDLGLKTRWIGRSNQLRGSLSKARARIVVFAATDASGSWTKVIEAGRQSGNRPVILASRVIDMPKYLDAMERGAFDFVVPPFAARDLKHVVESAISQTAQDSGDVSW
jgi:DNA-binding NtrC family response regulator